MKEIILKILSGMASQKERNKFFEELKQNEELAKEYAHAKCNYVFDNLPYSQNRLFRHGKIQNKKTINKISLILIKFAAIISIPLFIYFLYDIYNNKKYNIEIPTRDIPDIADIIFQKPKITPMIKYHTNAGIIGEVLLPDSSVVFLNCGSGIEFPAKFDSVQRVINFYGEGFFDIRSDRNRPLKINTSNGISVIVTGTKFNLNNYSNDNQFKLALADGNLSIYRSSTNSVINVNENDEIVINKTSEGTSSAYRITESDIDYITSWMHGILKFKNTPMPKVTNRLSNWYGYNIIIYSDEIKKYRFTGEFQSEPLINILETLRISSNIKYSIIDKNVILY